MLACMLALVVLVSGALALAGCGGSTTKSGSSNNKITVAWLPNDSAAEFDSGRQAFADALKEATGCDVELMTTTDYNVAIEAISSGKAQIALLGAEGYIQAEKQNPNVHALLTTSDENGTLDGAKYYSRICVPADQLSQYADSSSSTGYSLKNIKGKRMSFVSQSSTSGFKVPTSAIMKAFPNEISSRDELASAGFFSEVLFGGNHPGSCVNLLMGNCDVAAFDNEDVDPFLNVPAGDQDSVNKPGTVYSVKDGAAQPFDRVQGKSFGIIQSTPVLNGPIVYNSDVLSSDLVNKIKEGMTSDKVSNNEQIFGDKDNGALVDKEKSKGYIVVTDDWYDPIRAL
jgi:phosphonate transport system substrate-binding protein